MSDIFDHEMDAMLEQLDDDSRDAKADHRVVNYEYRVRCNKCTLRGFKWVRDGKNWILKDSTGARHICNFIYKSDMEEWRE